MRRREARAAGAARLFGYLEASDGSGDEYEAALDGEFAAGAHAHQAHAAHAHAPHAAHAAHAHAPAPQHYAATRDKENAAPLHHAVHHDHCLRY